ncbi:helix-turn-helix domain-containing protein [Rhizobium sp. PAMB 3174]
MSDIQHIERVYSLAKQGSAAASSPVVASWRRCMVMHSMAPEERRLPFHLDDAAFRQALERSELLVNEARSELDRLFQTVGKAGCCLILSDENGIALDRRGTVGDEKDFKTVGLWPGNVWTEASVGTNGIGTALADERSVTIYRDQHFLATNIGLGCTTSPIRDHQGRVTAALDISTCRDDLNEMTMSILSQAVRDTAGRIETNLFRRAFPGARIIMVPHAANPTNALLAVDQDDLVVGATRAARLALQLDDAQIMRGVPAADALQEARADEGGDLFEAERAALRRMLSRTNGNVSQAAELLGISRATMHRKMKKFSVH